MERAGLQARFVQGRRYTDEATLEIVARVLADRVKDVLGQPVLVENKAGANAAIGADYVAKSAPDGYTLFFTTISAVAMNPHMRSDLPYDPVRDFAPVSRMVLTKEVLVVAATSPVKTALRYFGTQTRWTFRSLFVCAPSR